MTSSPEFDAALALTVAEREKADGIKSLVSASKLAAKYQRRAEVAEATLAKVRALATLEATDPIVAASILRSIWAEVAS